MLHVGLTAELGVELGQGVAGTDSSSESDSKPELEADSVLDSESDSVSSSELESTMYSRSDAVAERRRSRRRAHLQT